MKPGVIVAVAIGAMIVCVAVVALARRRREREIPELNRHPERLEEELDASDDA